MVSVPGLDFFVRPGGEGGEGIYSELYMREAQFLREELFNHPKPQVPLVVGAGVRSNDSFRHGNNMLSRNAGFGSRRKGNLREGGVH